MTFFLSAGSVRICIESDVLELYRIHSFENRNELMIVFEC